MELVVNGDFETGDFTGWAKQSVSLDGDWFVYTGTLSPIQNGIILPPPVGNFATVTDQDEPDSNILYQDIAVPERAEVSCTAIVYVENRAEVGNCIIGDGLGLNTDNQQMRVDIMDPTANPFDTGAGVLQNLFQTLPGDPNSICYTTLNFDLTPYAGTTVRFRAAVVVTEFILNGSVDAVSCLAEGGGPATIPTLSEWGMISAVTGLGLIGVFFAVRRRVVKV